MAEDSHVCLIRLSFKLSHYLKFLRLYTAGIRTLPILTKSSTNGRTNVLTAGVAAVDDL
jgi:hypothetical protein